MQDIDTVPVSLDHMEMSNSLELPEIHAWEDDEEEELDPPAQEAANKRGVIRRDDSSIASVQEGRWRRVLSVHLVLALMLLLSVGLSVMSAEALGEHSCDSAIADTRDVMDRATRLLGESATHSLDAIGADLLGYAAVGVVESVRKYFTSGFTSSRGLDHIVTQNLHGVDKQNTAWWLVAAKRMWEQTSMLDDHSPVLLTGLEAGERLLFYYVANINPSAVQIFLLDGVNTSQSEAGSAIPETGWLDPTAEPDPTVKSYRTNISSFDFAGRYLADGETKFIRVVPFGSSIGVTRVQRWADPTGSVPFVLGLTFYSLEFVDSFLERLVVSMQTLEESSRPRAYIVMASSWLVKAMQDAGDPRAEEIDQTHRLVSVSHGNGSRLIRAISEVTGVMEDQREPLPDVNATDEVIRGVAEGIAGNYTKFQEFQQVDLSDASGALDVHFAGCERLQFDGLDMWIVLSLDELTFLGEVPAARAGIDRNISAEQVRVADDISHSRLVSRLIVVGIGVGLVLLALVASYLVMRPIKTLQVQMGRVAELDMTGLDLDYTSHLYEMRRIQYDFRKMVEHLVEFRAYVPSAVLQGRSSKETRKFIAPPTGHVAIVFTDIQGSTSLWKSSAGDMNCAMEIHNEVIRDVCLEFEGYEVKTIGDSFMVSFPCPIAATNFALNVQLDLAARRWPAGLGLPESGLVIRIGVNYGPTIAEKNPVTGRVDYRGSTVNLASRVEGKAKGGTVCITSDTYAAIKQHRAKLGNPTVQSHGIHEIKGLGGGHELYLVVPEAQRRRLNDAESDCLRRGQDLSRSVRSPAHRSPEPQSPFSKRSGSDSSDSRDKFSSGRRDRAGKTALQVTRGHVTVAVCRLQETKTDQQLFDNCNIMVRSAVEAAHASDGVIGNVTGNTLTVVWNAAKKCTRHTTAAVTFAEELRKLTDMLQVGLATGYMLHGNVGTKTSRFATTFGLPLETAEAMTDHARMFGVYCLYADCTSENRLQSEAALRTCVRLVDIWRDTKRARTARIYEVHLGHLANAMQMWMGSADATEPASSTADIDLEQHTKLVEGAMSGGEGLRALREAVAQRPEDRVLKRVLDMIEFSKPQGGFRCPVVFSRVPQTADYESIGGCLVSP
eukprot:TRINITY_DN2110_c0_g4_i1.p1 TRINITY_DN2110_c0_g4~~TRINITY_DN2110_c0_g4_i1.p1  ORF type:complete len:1118 (+),score=347.39 TRINITY_DN2110_c0_g4_i1:99-3452(+)